MDTSECQVREQLGVKGGKKSCQVCHTQMRLSVKVRADISATAETWIDSRFVRPCFGEAFSCPRKFPAALTAPEFSLLQPPQLAASCNWAEREKWKLKKNAWKTRRRGHFRSIWPPPSSVQLTTFSPVRSQSEGEPYSHACIIIKRNAAHQPVGQCQISTFHRLSFSPLKRSAEFLDRQTRHDRVKLHFWNLMQFPKTVGWLGRTQVVKAAPLSPARLLLNDSDWIVEVSSWSMRR